MSDLHIKLRKLDELTLMELLEINSEDLVDAFLEKIEEKRDYLYGQIQEQEEDV